MDKDLKYYIIKKHRLIVEVLEGAISLNDYISFKKKQFNDKDFNSNCNFIVDIRGVDIVFSIELKKRMREYFEFEKSFNSLSNEKKVAVITKTPDQVVYSTINNALDEGKTVYRIFSSKEAALNWLSISSSEMDIIK